MLAKKLSIILGCATALGIFLSTHHVLATTNTDSKKTTTPAIGKVNIPNGTQQLTPPLRPRATSAQQIPTSSTTTTKCSGQSCSVTIKFN